VPLDGSAVDDIIELAGRCVAADGGLPDSAGAGFVTRRYAAEGGQAIGAYVDGRLVAAAGVRPSGAALHGIGLVDPGRRGRGLGSAALDWCLARASVIETESLSDGAAALFAARGLRQTFAEDVMRHDLAQLPEVSMPAGVLTSSWSAETIDRFHRAYRASFAQRPGFPDWDRTQWTDWLVDDEFRPDWSLLAHDGERDLGFVVCGDGWLVQVGTVPAARGRGIGAALTVAALRLMRAAGQRQVLLDVNVNNPGAAGLYRRLGFAPVGRRARFSRD
jgi:mycothiol synthase